MTEARLSAYTAHDGENLAVMDWPLEHHTPGRGTVVIVHGLGEHVGRYDPVAERLNAWGFAVRGYDHHGHGDSSGKPGALPTDTHLLDDLADILDSTRRRMDPRSPLILLGHSLGGLVAARLVSLNMRKVEGLVLSGIAGFYVANLVELAQNPSRVVMELARGLEPRTWAVVALTALVALVGSFLVSYTRARAEGLGLECRVGWFERPERMVLLIVAGLFGVGPVMPGALLLLAMLSFATAAQRVLHVYRLTRPGPPPAG